MSQGQFEDAPSALDPTAPVPAPVPGPSTVLTAPLAPQFEPRQAGVHYLDDDEEEEEEDYDEEEWNSEDARDQEVEDSLTGGLNEVMDQDWDVVSGDFTKRYNRMRQHVVATHAALPRFTALVASSDPAVRPGNIVPASNRARAVSARPSTDPSVKAGIHTNKVSDQLATYSRYAARIDLAPLYPTSATVSRKGGSEKVLVKDKSDRATNEQVLDPRTRLILFKMIGRELIERVDGCVSTGKEANVYHAVSPDQKHLALKIYKTSILVFKDRDRYVSGEFRFKSGYARSNPRKMVRLWAEKEMRNLRRMRTAGMRVPEAFEVRENVLVMEFMGADEWQASPRLKDADIPTERLRDLYIEMLVILRTIFVRCKLVHADFSEYNVLYHEGHLVVIDVSQSVEQDHPAAFDFLRSDIRNADDFFARRGLDTLGLTRTFNYVTRPSATSDRAETDEEMQAEAERLLTAVELEELEVDHDEEEDGSAEQSKKPSASDEAVFAQSYIPRALDQVYDPERDVARVLRGEGKGLIYANITGVASIRESESASASTPQVRFAAEDQFEGDVVAGAATEENGDESGSGSGSESGSEDEDEGEGEYDERKPRGKKFEDKDEKKARRAETKEKARDKRTQKMSKGEKARKIRKGSGKK